MGKLYNEELNDLNSSPNVFWVIKSGSMRWAGHIARIGRRGAYGISVRGRYYLEDPNVEGRIIFKYMFRKWDGVRGLDRLGSG